MGRFFDGSTGYITGPSLMPVPPLTFAAFVYPTTTIEGGFISGSVNSYYFRQSFLNLALINENIVVIGASPPVLTQFAWNHVACSYDGTIASFYCNGLPVMQINNPQSLASGTVFMALGINHAGFGTTEFYTGGMSRATLYTSILNPAEVKQLSQGAWPLAIRKSSVFLFYPMIGPLGANEPDASGNGQTGSYTGTITAFPDPPQIVNQQRYRDTVLDPFRWATSAAPANILWAQSAM